jgi:hypothetical protein
MQKNKREFIIDHVCYALTGFVVMHDVSQLELTVRQPQRVHTSHLEQINGMNKGYMSKEGER